MSNENQLLPNKAVSLPLSELGTIRFKGYKHYQLRAEVKTNGFLKHWEGNVDKHWD